jgi:crotonobetainyl-CoA:carnitine CoA-transferase CaiB-like acyl-CoA transferase
MLDAALAFIPGTVSEYTVAGIKARQLGNGSVSRKPTASRFRARGGYIVLAVLTEKQFASLMKALGRADALADPRFKDWAARTANEAALRQIIEEALASDDPKSWEDASHRRRRAVRLHLEDRRDRGASAARAPRRAADDRLALRADAPRRLRVPAGARQPGLDREPPTLGEHTDEVLREAGLGADEIERLRRESVI